MALQVKKAGLLTQIHDMGRFGHSSNGLTHGGPMDEIAHCWANWMLGNSQDCATLEVTYGQLSLVCNEPCTIALTGGDLGATLNGHPLKPWCTVRLKANDELHFGVPEIGMRAYIALAGGIECIKKFGSATTVAREKVGGIRGDGSALKVGDVVNGVIKHPSVLRDMPSWAIPTYSTTIELNLIAGYQFSSFSKAQIFTFLNGQYKVTDKIDRMGYRLEGPPIHSSLKGIISEGIALGSVQIPSDGQPIILLKDRQTIGGYPKIGTVFSLDLSQLAQSKPGDGIHFNLMDIAEAENKRVLFERNFI